jgi:hypothetical protein
VSNTNYSDDPSNDMRYEVIKHIREARNNGYILINTGRNLVQAGQSMVDWSFAAETIVPLIRSPKILQEYDSLWVATNSSAERLRNRLDPIEIEQVSTSTGMSAFTSMALLIENEVTKDIGPEQQEEAQTAISRIRDLASQPYAKSLALDLMNKMKLGSSCEGERSPIEQFETAHAALNRTIDSTNPAITSLIPMRSCINGILSFLLKKRSSQEKAKRPSDKVKSILLQLKRDWVSCETIDTLAIQSDELVEKQLTPAKDKAIPREEWLLIISSATIWISSFLQAIDQSRI